MSITYEVKVDWDATDWMATPDFSQGIDEAMLKPFILIEGRR